MKLFVTKLFFILIFLPKILTATHIVGGEVYYNYLGNNQYKIFLDVFRDCYNGIPPLDNPAFVTIYNSSNTVVMTLNLNLDSTRIIDQQTINNPCINPPNNVCVQKGAYSSDPLTLPPIVGGYYIVYQRCCRNNSILNLVNPGDAGSSYWEHIPGSELVNQNNSPRYNLFPPVYICNGIPIEFNHSATDPDGDQLVYSICAAFNGLDKCCPIIGYPPSSSSSCPTPPPTCPQVNTPPPYQNVIYQTPYSGAYPLSSNPAMNINSSTGFLNGVPNVNGQWVVAICVQEFRNGVLIGTHTRDFQFNVSPCNVANSAAVASQTTYCNGFNVDFDNLSFSNLPGATSYFWDFGVDSLQSDTSRLFEPSYTYPDTGRYQVTLVVNGGNPCADTAKVDFYVYPILDADFNYTYINACATNNSFDFVSGGSFAPYSTFSWNFGTSAVPQFSNTSNQNDVQFFGSGSFPVTLTITQALCTDSVRQIVQVYRPPVADFSLANFNGCQPLSVQFRDSSQSASALTYLWTFGDGSFSTLQNPTHIYADTGVYDISLMIISQTGCIDTNFSVLPQAVTVYQSPQAGFQADQLTTTFMNPIFNFTDISQNAVSVNMNMGDGTIYNSVPPTHVYDNSGEYNVMQIVKGENGCPDTFSLKLIVVDDYVFYLPNAFTPNKDSKNEIFKPVVSGIYDYEFFVFDRWGELIFQTTNTDEGWDGTYKGEKCQQDVYVYKIRYFDIVENLPHQKAGTFSLIR